MERVCLDGERSPGAKFCRPAQQHLVGEVGRQHGSSILRPMAQQRQRHIPGSTAEVENLRIGPGRASAKTACRPAPPDPVDIAGEHMIQEIVAGGDSIEH